MWIDTNDCPERFHEIKRTDEGTQVVHADDSLCNEVEFELKEGE